MNSLFQRNRIGLEGPQGRRAKRRRVTRLEILEDRTLLAASATLDIAAGTLSYVVTGGSMNLTVSVDASDVYTIRDASEAIVLGSGASGAGWTLSTDQHTATGPAASFSQIAVTGDAGSYDDHVVVNSSKAPMTINTGAGDDVFGFNAPAIMAPLTLTNPLSGGSDGDAVNFVTGGVAGTFATGQRGRESYQAAGAGLINVTSVKPNSTDGLWGLSIAASTLKIDLNSLYATPTPLATSLSVVGSNVQVTTTNVPARYIPNGSIASLKVEGTSGGNALTIDYAGGVPYGAGVTYSPPPASGGASNALTLKNGSFTQEAYLASGAGKGSIIFPNRQVNGVTIGNQIDFDNLSPITDTVTVAGFTFTAPVGGQTVNIVDGPVVSGAQTTQINDGGTTHFEQISFANKKAATINTGSGADVVTVDMSAAAAGLTGLAVATGDADDGVTVMAVPTGVALQVDAGAGASNLITLTDGGSLAGIQGSVAVKSTGGQTALRLDDTADATGRNFTITPGQVSGAPLGSPVDYAGGGITGVQFLGGSGDDLFTLNGFGSPTTAVQYSIEGGPGTDTLDINSSVAPVNIATPGTIDFGAGHPLVVYASLEQININQNTAAPPVGIPVVLHATEARTLIQQTVARFTDVAPGGTVNYYASIDWGDGTPASGGTIVPTGVTGSYDILGGHTYAAAATYPVNVTLTRVQGGTSTTTTVGGVPITTNTGGTVDSVPSPIASSAVVAAAPLWAQGIPLGGRATAALGSTAGGVQIAAFMDTGTNLPASSYTALIYWGDGSAPTAATQITAIGAPGGMVYNVFGNHTYSDLGTYPVTVLVTKPPTAVTAPVVAQPSPGAQAIAVSTATILDAPLRTVTGQLNPASDTGASNSDGITRYNQVNYFGFTDSPGATVAVVATPYGGTPVLLGATQSDNAGAWNVTSTVALPDGAYSITVYASDHYNGSSVVSAVLPQTLQIDTVGPKVVGAVFTPLSGYALVTYQDYGGWANAGAGVNLATVQDPNNYAFSFVSSQVRGYRPPSRWLIGPIATSPGTTSGPQAATVLINGGTPIRGGVYELKISSASSTPAGVQDLAGNALDGEFYSTFPSGNNINGGDFVARLDSIHNRVFSPQTVVGPGTPTRTPPVRKQPVRITRTLPAASKR